MAISKAAASAAAQSRKERVLSREEIGTLIEAGRAILIIDNTVINADTWLPFHPGGEKAIRHMVGRDASDEIKALHSIDARHRMIRLRIGRIDGPWENIVPPIHRKQLQPKVALLVNAEENEQHTSRPLIPQDDFCSSSSESESTASQRSVRYRCASASMTPLSSVSSLVPGKGDQDRRAAHIDLLTQKQVDLDAANYPPTDPATQRLVVAKYRNLYDKLLREGYFNCNYMAYGEELIRYSLLFTIFVVLLRHEWFALSGLFLGLLWHQLVFTVHDAGHMGITHNFTIDTVIGMTIASHIGGLSLGWWKRNHNVHHIVTNSPEHDPDIEHMPFFMISHRFFKSLRSTYYERVMEYNAFAKFMATYQRYLYYPVLLFGRFNLYRLSWVHLLWGQGPRQGPAWWHRWYEVVGNIFFWYWFGYLVLYRSIPTTADRVAFVLVSHFITAPLHVQITLSHFAMSTSDLGINESFPQKMLRTTMDVDCPAWLDFVHGGLQFQAIHHLYPRMPRHNLRKAQALVQEFCREVGIPYALYGFVDGNKQVIGRLAEVGRQAKILAQCQEHVVMQMGRA